jgi:acyl-CoA reductase-like NAD-dependent aldehyde dehydrogenase
MSVAREEVFGPVFTVLTYDDMDDAVAIANDCPYGLTAAMFTHDTDLARSVGRRLRVGSFTVNSTGASSASRSAATSARASGERWAWRASRSGPRRR